MTIRLTAAMVASKKDVGRQAGMKIEKVAAMPAPTVACLEEEKLILFVGGWEDALPSEQNVRSLTVD
jgi:hypothetical protein